MKVWSFADQESGIFHRKIFRGPERALRKNTPSGMIPICGIFKSDTHQVDWESGYIVEREGAQAKVSEPRGTAARIQKLEEELAELRALLVR